MLVATRANSFFVNLTSTIYILLDFGLNIYKYGECDNDLFVTTTGANRVEAMENSKKKIGYYIAFKILWVVPVSIFYSFIVIKQIYTTFIIFVDFLFRQSDYFYRHLLREKSRDTLFCSICNVDDENEIIYTQCDFNYVLELVNRKEKSQEDLKSVSSIEKKADKSQKPPKIEREERLRYKHSEIVEKKRSPGTFGKLFRRFVYDWQENFKFSSRYATTKKLLLKT
jgi:hypothetical protein